MRSPSLAIALCLWLAVTACTEIKVVGQDAAPSEDQSGSSDASDVSMSDADSDTATNDVVGNDCLTDFDCFDKIQGKTPCISAKCSAGFCVKVQKSVGATCKDSTLTPGDCGQTTCDAGGQCVISSVKDGSVCGAGLCGKKCAAGQCIAATDADYDDGNACTKDFCDQGIQVKHEPITDLTLVCDDKDACTSGDTCIQGACKGTLLSCSDGIPCTLDTCSNPKGCAHTTDNSKCDDGNACTSDGCDLALGCTVTAIATGKTCDDGNECTVSDACDAVGGCGGQPSDACKCASDADCAGKTQNLCIGALVCQGGGCVAVPSNAVYCDPSQNSTCLQNACEPASGKCIPKQKNAGGPCDDGNECTTTQTCQGGQCQGIGALECDDNNPCTNDVCVPQSGCVHEATGNACDDGNACTTGDVCTKGACGGVKKPCDDGIACTFDSCDKTAGGCTHSPDKSTCDDGNPCTSDTCDAAKGCAYGNDDAAKCDDDNACTANACQGGTCSATPICACNSDAECNDNNPCTTDTCSANACTFKPADGGACDPADKCQTPGSGTCGGGVCKAGDAPKDCSSVSDACHSGTCNPGTGQCDALPKGDGTLCDADKDGCTVADACVAGTCVAGQAMDCSAKSDGCNIGVCKNNADGGYCTAQAKDAGSACEDGAYCTDGDTCDGAGTCVAGAAKTCGQASDACNTGYCDEEGKACAKTPKGADVGCDDGQFCTSYDHCDGGGACIGAVTTYCPSTACATGSCDATSEACMLAPSDAGSACSDGDPCTINDTCDGGGTCIAGTPVACEGNACNSGYCDPTTGGCALKPLPAVNGCDDGQSCTSADHCDGYGVCVGGPWDAACGCNTDAMCDDGNSCTADTCDVANGACNFQILAGQKCDDGDNCTTASACNADGVCAATALYDCSKLSDTCHVGQCYSSTTGAGCKVVALADGSACEDGLFCTTSEVCVNGQCGGGSAVLCPAAPTCFTASCSEAAKGCTTTPAAKGTLCTDGESCTLGETCDGAGTCGGGSAMANFAICDDGDKYTSGDLCLNAQCAGFTAVTGASGPITRLTYDSTGDSWWFASALYSAPSVAAATKWAVSELPIDANGTWNIGKPAATQNGGPIRALSPQTAGGAGGFAAFHVPGSKSWVVGTSAGFGKAASTAFATTTEWYDTAFRQNGKSAYAMLSGYNGSEGAVLGRCQGNWGDTTTSWSCTKGTSVGMLGNGAAISAYNSLCFPVGSCTPTWTFLGGLLKWNGSFASQLDTIAATGMTGAWGTVSAGPNVKPTSALTTGALLAYDTSSYQLTGGSVQWLVGSSGSIAYVAAGSSVLNGLALYGTNYQFTDVTSLNGYVLIWGYKTDTLTGNLIPVLLSHADVVGTQTDPKAWVEHNLALPAYNTSACASSAFSSYGMAKGGASGTTLALAGNYCGNTTSGSPPNLRGMVYVRK